jgi:hypothetical protein
MQPHGLPANGVTTMRFRPLYPEVKSLSKEAKKHGVARETLRKGLANGKYEIRDGLVVPAAEAKAA